MATTEYQIQLNEVDPSGNVTKMFPQNKAQDVLVGSLSAGSLTLPGNSANEKLSDTLKNIRKYLSNLATVANAARGVSSSLTSTSTTDLATSKAVNDLKTGQDTINSTLSTHASNINGKAPKAHAASDTTYGQATGSLYGHVKMSDTYSSKVDSAAAANGIAASQNALYNAYNGLNTAKAPNNHASSAATYGKGTSSVFGHLKISDTYTSKVSGGDAAGAIAASQNAVYNAYHALKTTVDGHTTSISGKAPTSHATNGTTYGIGTGTNYGHVKLSDNYSTDTSSTGAAANGVAASNWAVYRAYTAAIGDAATKLNNHAAVKGTGSAYGHVKLSDNYTSSAGAASASIGASSKAVYDCYATLLSSITTLQNSVNNLNSVFSNPNILHNPAFLINQRGGTINVSGTTYDGYNVDWAYGFDRWRLSANQNPNPTYYYKSGYVGYIVTKGMRQYIEYSAQYTGCYLTVSGMTDSGEIIRGTTDSPLSLTDSWKSWAYVDDGKGTCIRILTEAGYLVVEIGGKLRWVKLEIGKVATPYIPENQATDMLNCKRFFELVNIFGTTELSANTKKIILSDQFSVVKRVADWGTHFIKGSAYFQDTQKWEDLDESTFNFNSWKDYRRYLVVANLDRPIVDFNIIFAANAEI